MPPHLGHLYLVDFARRYCEDLTVVVGSLAREPIAGELRVAWMRELFPQVRVVHLTDENPQLPHEHPDFWAIWKASLERIVARARGFVYAVGLMGVTGERAALADSATVIASRLKAITDVPVLVGVGISSPEQAVEVCEVADGVVVGTALVRRVLETRSPEAAGELIGSFRDALDRG